MARYIVRNKIVKVEEIKSFDYAGYKFDASTSSDQEFIFKRDQA